MGRIHRNVLDGYMNLRRILFTLGLCTLLTIAPAFAENDVRKDVLRTPGGNSMNPPASWRQTVQGKMIRFDAPEGDLSLVVVDVGEASDAGTAAQAAWAVFRPDDRHKVSVVAPRPGRRGWDERVDLSYETSASEHLELYASAFRRGRNWTVVIVDGTQETAEKQYGALALAQTSLHPPGYVKESFSGRAPNPLDASRIAAMRSFMETAIDQLQIPGASFALLDHGKIVYEGGVGVKKLGSAERVDADTRFMIASNTKGMTTLLLATLVDQNKITWDEPIVRVYPSFRLGDPATTSAVRVRDLVCACTGLPRTDMDWLFNTPAGTPAARTFAQLATMQPTSKFGEVFQYNNQMASAAGYIAGHLIYPEMELGAAYDRAMQERIFSPLGMTDTTFSFTKALSTDVALPSDVDIDDHTAPVDLSADLIARPFRPSAGAWSSVHDMIKYVGLELSKGVLPNGKRIVSEKNLLIRRAHGVSTGENQWYGMGLWEDENSGIPVIFHGGNMPGYISDIVVLPSVNVGAVILTNGSNGAALRLPFRRRLLELLFDGRPEATEDVAFAAKRLRAGVVDERTRLILPVYPKVVAGLAQHYANAELGPLDVHTDPTGTRIDTNSFTSLVASRRNDDGSTSLETISPGMEGFQFVVGGFHGHRALTLQDGQHAYTFEAK